MYNDANNLEEKDIMSLILSFGLTKKQSDKLIEELYLKFNTLYKIVNAKEEELLKIKNLGKKKIELIKSIEYLLFCYTRSNLKEAKKLFKRKDLINHLTITLRPLKFEIFLIACIDAKKRFISAEQIFRGSIDTATIYPREVIEHSLSKNAKYVVIAHNHPSGMAQPSREDIIITKTLIKSFNSVGISVIDHIIIANDIYSFRERGILV